MADRPGTVLPARITDSAVINYAHRGASGYAPENTLAAFGRAAGLGANAVELDLRRTLDGHLVVLHDATLGRTTDVARVFAGRGADPVESFTLAELRRLDAGAWFGAEFAGERVPTLAEAMDVLSGHGLGLLLEVKEPDRYPGLAEELAAVLRTAPGGWLRGGGRLTVESFDWDFVRALRATLPRVCVGLLGAPAPAQLAAFTGFADQINPAQTDITAEYVESIHQCGMAVNVWTVDEPAALERMVAAGVDGIISNRPDRVRAVVQATASLS